MSIYCPLAEALGIQTSISILDIHFGEYDENGIPLPPWNKGLKTGPESEETKIKKSISQMGNKNAAGNNGKPKSSIHRKKISLSNCKGQWKITLPNGESVIILSLRKYCIDNNLSQSAMSDVSLGNRSHHKGYRCQRL